MRDIFGELEEMVREDIEKMEYDIDCWLPEAIDKSIFRITDVFPEESCW